MTFLVKESKSWWWWYLSTCLCRDDIIPDAISREEGPGRCQVWHGRSSTRLEESWQWV